MNMSYIRLVGLFIIIACTTKISAQENLIIFHEPEVSINHKFSDGYKANFGIAARHFMYEDNTVSFKNRHLQLSHFSTFSLRYNKSTSLGILYRNRDWFEDSTNELRLTQQYNYIKQTATVRFGHRFRSEQRISNKSTTYRFRYRFALDTPLEGEKLDIGEPYIIANTEFLLSLNSSSHPEIDNRITSQIGWLLSESIKLQLGLQYRFEAFNLETQNILLLLSSVVLKI